MASTKKRPASASKGAKRATRAPATRMAASGKSPKKPGPAPAPRGEKTAPKLIYLIKIDAARGVIESKDVPVSVRPRDAVRWVADRPFEVVFTQTSDKAKGLASALKCKPDKRQFVIDLSFSAITKLTRLEYEVRIDGKVIDPIIIIDPARVVLLAS